MTFTQRVVQLEQLMDITYGDLRQNLKSQIHRVCETHEPLYITSHKTPKAVLMSYEDYSSLEETAYLLQNPEPN